MSPRTAKQLEIIREDKVQRISEAALKLFAAHGYERTSISEIAREAGISKGLIYNYFTSKEDLLSRLVEEIFDKLWERMGFVGIEKMTDEDYLKFINLSFDLVLEDLNHWRLYFAIFTQPKVLSLLMVGLMERSAPYLKILENYYREQGHENPEVWMRYVAAIMDGIQLHIMLDPENFPLEEVRKIVIRQLISKE